MEKGGASRPFIIIKTIITKQGLLICNSFLDRKIKRVIKGITITKDLDHIRGISNHLIG